MFENNTIEWKLLAAGTIFLGIALMPYSISLAITRLLLVSVSLPVIMFLLLRTRREPKNRFLTP